MSRKLNVKSMLFGAFLLLLVTCCYGKPQGWLSPPAERVRRDESPLSWPQLEGENSRPILQCQKDNAMRMLQNKKFVALDSNEVKRLTGKLEKRSGRYYLIRSLRFTDGTAGFFLGWKNQQLWSHAGMLGSDPHLVKYPLVVRVSKPIKNLYITVDVIE